MTVRLKWENLIYNSKIDFIENRNKNKFDKDSRFSFHEFMRTLDAFGLFSTNSRATELKLSAQVK